MSELAFAVCNPGSEPMLLRELARIDATPAYRRKGLVTFKLDRWPHAQPVFARVWGRSVGLSKSDEETLAKLAEAEGSRLHVYPRDPSDDASRAQASAVEAALRSKLRFAEGVLAEPGDRVADVIVAAGEPTLIGERTQADRGWRTPGGRVVIDVPPDAPSRAFAKLEEALAWSGLALREGETAVELGSAPGGAAYALARRGVHVLGVDPAAMDPRVLAYVGPSGARVRHLGLSAGALRRQHVPREASILVCDANLAPPVALRTVASIASWLRGSLRAMVLTLKMNDDRMVDAIPSLLDRVRALGMRVEATQLPANRREICAVAWSTEV